MDIFPRKSLETNDNAHSNVDVWCVNGCN